MNTRRNKWWSQHKIVFGFFRRVPSIEAAKTCKFSIPANLPVDTYQRIFLWTHTTHTNETNVLAVFQSKTWLLLPLLTKSSRRELRAKKIRRSNKRAGKSEQKKNPFSEVSSGCWSSILDKVGVAVVAPREEVESWRVDLEAIAEFGAS